MAAHDLIEPLGGWRAGCGVEAGEVFNVDLAEMADCGDEGVELREVAGPGVSLQRGEGLGGEGCVRVQKAQHSGQQNIEVLHAVFEGRDGELNVCEARAELCAEAAGGGHGTGADRADDEDADRARKPAEKVEHCGLERPGELLKMREKDCSSGGDASGQRLKQRVNEHRRGGQAGERVQVKCGGEGAGARLAQDEGGAKVRGDAGDLEAEPIYGGTGAREHAMREQFWPRDGELTGLRMVDGEGGEMCQRGRHTIRRLSAERTGR